MANRGETNGLAINISMAIEKNSMICVVNKHRHDTSNNDFYIGGGSPLGNPFYFGESNHAQAQFKVANLEEAIISYESYLTDAILSGHVAICNALNELIIRRLTGKPANIVCFCKPKPCHGDVIKTKVDESKYCLNWFSNMRRFDAPLRYQEINYWTVENFYQAMKTSKSNLELRQKIAQMNPYSAKMFAKKLDLNSDWHEKKLSVMEFAIKHKFQEGSGWKAKLDGTKDTIIEWNNWGDKFWGKSIFDQKGENNLGVIIEKFKQSK